MRYIYFFLLSFICVLSAEEELPPLTFKELKAAFVKGDYQGFDKELAASLVLVKERNEILLLKVEWEMLKGDFKAALSSLDSLKNHEANYTLYLRYLALEGFGDLKKLENFISGLSAEQSTSSGGLVVLYKWSVFKGDYEKAEDYLNDLDDKFDSPKDMTAVDHFFRAQVLQDDDPAEAYKAYQRAYKKDANNYRFRVLAAHHCETYYAMNYAEEEFNAVLKKNPNQADALAGLADLQFQNNALDQSEALAKKALEINDHHSLALQVLAAIHSIKGDEASARSIFEGAKQYLSMDLGFLASWAALEDIAGNEEKRDELISEVLAINPKCAELYIALAANCERNHFLERAAAWSQKAIDLRENFWAGYYSRGVALLRLGEEREGYDLVDKAFEMNAFNFWAKNMLVLLDRDFRKKEYVLYETDHYVIKMHKDEAEIMGEYAKQVVEAAWEKYTKKYNFFPKGPRAYDGRILFLLFKTHNDFSVRTVGLPGLGAGGATFGQVITMPSPKAMHRGREYAEFNWVRVFEHEFVHVLTLQMSDYHIPRWLTEGISTWEEVDFDLQYDEMIRNAFYNGRLPDLFSMNDGFMQQEYQGQMAVSYYQSALFSKFYVEKYGFDSLRQAIGLMAKKDCVESLAQVAGVDPLDLNKEFQVFQKSWIDSIPWPMTLDEENREELSAALVQAKSDDDFELYLSYLLSSDKADQAEKLIRARISYLGRGLEVLGHFYFKQGEKDVAYKYFNESLGLKHEGFINNYYLGLKAIEDKDDTQAKELISRAQERYPRFTSKNKKLNPYELLISLEKGDKLIGFAKKQSELNVKLFSAAVTYGEILNKSGQKALAVEAYEQANEINPYDLGIHLKLGELNRELKDFKKAIHEFSVAAELEPRNQVALEGAMMSALEAGDKIKARSFARRLKRFYKEAKIPVELEK